MIVIKIEMWPAGHESRAHELVRVFAQKLPGSTRKLADYEFAVMRRGEKRAPWKHGDGTNETAKPLHTGFVRGHAREAYHVLRLVKRGITAMFPAWRAKLDGPVEKDEELWPLKHTVVADDAAMAATVGLEENLHALGQLAGLSDLDADLRGAFNNAFDNGLLKRLRWAQLTKHYSMDGLLVGDREDRHSHVLSLIKAWGHPPEDAWRKLAWAIIGQDGDVRDPAQLDEETERLRKDASIYA